MRALCEHSLATHNLYPEVDAVKRGIVESLCSLSFFRFQPDSWGFQFNRLLGLGEY